ncbi:MAG: hypothetical protein RLZZ301_260, partial [Bacteroidota bacterium]
MRLFLLLALLFSLHAQAQLRINEGCSKNAASLLDENNDAPDWIELYNAGNTPLNLAGYHLTDKAASDTLWTFPNVSIGPHGFTTVFCSGKDRYGSPPFVTTSSTTNFSPVVGWNTHTFSQAFNWDGVSNILINTCSYSNSGYTENSVFYQSSTPFASCIASFIDGSPAACSANNGQVYYQRPNLRLNNIQIGYGTTANATTDYPAPYGNWYWGSRHQLLILASELQAAGLTAGPITSLSFQVASTNTITYTYFDVALNLTTQTELTNTFYPLQGEQLHTNFKISGNGERVFLFDDQEQVLDSLKIESPQPDISVGLQADGTTTIKWLNPSPGASNNLASAYADTLLRPLISMESGIYSGTQSISISNPNSFQACKVVYTLDGTEPLFSSQSYTNPIVVNSNKVLRAKVYPTVPNTGYLPSEQAVETYLFGISHTTPILLVTTDPTNLYGSNGIFDNWSSDWVKAAHAVILDTGSTHPLLFSGKTAMRMDGGAGGSRSQPQHSFRLSFTHGTYGENAIHETLQPDRPNRHKYSDLYLRNGSNQFLQLPYKDACAVRMLSEGTSNYYSAYRPISVYINGNYFGLYELREKFNTEYFETLEGADPDSVELLSLSYWYNLILRAVEGDVAHFTADYAAFNALNPTALDYWTQADQYIDLKQYTDYIIAESWIGNTDWPGNNIKIYRSNASNNRWRFALIDLELSLQPNGWTNCTDNHLAYMMGQSEDNPFINIWKQSILNLDYRNYFINRFADLMNTSYRTDLLLAREQSFYDAVLPEMPKEFERWGDPNNIAGQMQTFTNNHLTYQDQLACRSTFVFNQLKLQFGLTKKVTLNLDVFPENAGTIHLNSITPSTYPWSGTYFDGVPVQLTAQANPGWIFSHWEPISFVSDTLNPLIDTNVNLSNQLFKAIFKLAPPPP